MAGQGVRDPPVAPHRGVEGVDGRAGQPEYVRDPLPAQDRDRGVRGSHPWHFLLPSGKLLDQLEQRRVIQPAVSLRLQRGDQLRDDRSERDHHAGLSRGGGDDAHVLVVQRDAETGPEVAGQHRGALALQHRVAGQPAAQDAQGRLGVDAVGLEEDDRLGHELDDARDHELVRGLDRLARARGPDVHDGLAHGGEDRCRGLEVGGRAADHDRQHALDGALLAAGYRRVEHAEAPLGALGGQFRRYVRADAREVDHQRPGRRVLEDPAGTGQHRAHVGGVRHHRGHHVGVTDRLGDVRRAAPPGRDELLDPAGAPVVPGDVETGLDQVGRHRRPHDPQPDEADPRAHEGSFPARRSRGSHARLASVVPVGLYSRLTQPRYPRSSSALSYRSRSRWPLPGSPRPGASAICTWAVTSACAAIAASMSSPLLARWYRSQRKPTLAAPAARARCTTATASSAVRSGYGLGPLTGSISTVAPIPATAFAASAMFSVASSSWAAGSTPSIRFPYSALKPRTPSRRPIPAVTSMLSRNSALRPGIDSTPQSGPARSPAKKFRPASVTPASSTAVVNASTSPSDGTGVANGHQNSTAENPAARAAAGLRSSGSSVNNSEQLTR